MTDGRSEYSTTDASLIVRYQSGEDDAATALYTRYAARLLEFSDRATGDYLLSRIDAEDIVQSVFRTFFRRVSDGQYLTPDGEELWKLLLVISLNKVRDASDFHRAKKRDVSQTKPLGSHESTGSIEPSVVLRMTIEDMLVSLPEAHREIVRDRIDGYEVAEISARTSTSRRSVERILQSFRNRLRNTLDMS